MSTEVCEAKVLSERDNRRPRVPCMQGRLEAISEATTPEALADAIAAASDAIGFPCAQVMVVNPTACPSHVVGESCSDKVLRLDGAIVVGSNLSSARNPVFRDPVRFGLRPLPLPVVWSGRPRCEGWAEADGDGRALREHDNGITMQVPLPVDEFIHPLALVVSVHRREAIRAEEQMRMSADVTLLAMYAAVGCRRALIPLLLSTVHARSPLTPAMRQYLLWAERGKTAAETAEIVGRKYSTVKNVIAQALQRLGCTRKADAVRCARANGWL
jgi:DNA-binding CsgD family transcriptional regulator